MELTGTHTKCNLMQHSVSDSESNTGLTKEKYSVVVVIIVRSAVIPK